MGNSGSSYCGNILYELDLEKNDWQKKSERPTHTGRENAIVAVVGSKAYFGLGVTGTNGYYNDFWEYTPGN
jgi:N-acetylneuraminic acid mutarotase